MSPPIKLPNRSPPSKVEMETSVETFPIDPRASSLDKREKENISKTIWKSIKARAAVFNVFDRGKVAQQPLPDGSAYKAPLGAPLDPQYDDDDSDEGGKLKNEHDRTLCRSGDIDRRKSKSARITITTADGNFDFAYLPKPPVDESSTPSLALNSFNNPSTVNQSTTALSTVRQKTGADEALLDFPEMGSDIAKYIRDGTPTPSNASAPSENAAPVFGFIPYDERVRSYDKNFELSYSVASGADQTPKARVRPKSVRFASNDIDIRANMAAEEAVKVHIQWMENRASNAANDEQDRADGDEQDSRPKSLLPRPACTTTSLTKQSVTILGRMRTPSPTKMIRKQASNTFIAKRSPSPLRGQLGSKKSMTFRGRSPSPVRRPLGSKESMTFRGRSKSPARKAYGLASPPKAILVQHPLASPSKTNLVYESPSKKENAKLSPMKALPESPRPQTPASPTRLTAENTRLNTPTSPMKLTPVLSQTPNSPLKGSVRSYTPTSPSKSSTPVPSSLTRGREAHLAAATQKAAEVAELKRKNLDMLAQKKAEDEAYLNTKRNEIALKRQASQVAMKSPASPALKAPAAKGVSRLPVLAKKESKLPMLAKKESRLPLLAKKESTMAMRKPGPNTSTSFLPKATSALPGRTTSGLTSRDSTQSLRPKDSKSSLKEKPSQIGLAQKGRSASSKPTVKSKLGEQMKNAE